MAESNYLQVRCVDNTLQRDLLSLGRTYEVTRVLDRDGYFELGALGRFSCSRFEIVTAEHPEGDGTMTADRHFVRPGQR